MKGINILLVFTMAIWACQGQISQPGIEGPSLQTSEIMTFGHEMDATGAKNDAEMLQAYAQLSVGDTLMTKFNARVTDVCKAKGCWMTVELPNGEQAMVRFKDYGFFMPMDITGKEVVVNGLAFVDMMGLDDQKHFAKDAGKTEEEINKITQPKKTYLFEADGVLLKQ
ncbi:MAG: DUF4920 domain-containing protein [Flavobacteriaceae bacterium]